MAKSPFSGFTTRYSERYKNLTLVKVTNKHGNTHCTKCKCETKLSLDGEHLQRGFPKNKYYEFIHCENCGYRFCIVMLMTEADYNAS